MKQYIKTFNNTDDVDSILYHLKQQTWTKGTWTNNKGETVESNPDDCCMYVPTTDDHPIYTNTMNLCMQYGQQYQKEFHYIKLSSGVMPRYNRYLKGERMHRHVDHIYSCFDGVEKGIPIISLIGFLNDDYEGGELVFTLDTEKYVMKPKRGDIVVFPSAFPWEHEVLPVVSGERYTWVSWCW